MDITGKNPTSERGKYFGNNVHYWHPLADFCQQVAPEITSACRYWHSNDGHGLDAVASLALADALQAAIDSRRAAVFEAPRGGSNRGPAGGSLPPVPRGRLLHA